MVTGVQTTRKVVVGLFDKCVFIMKLSEEIKRPCCVGRAGSELAGREEWQQKRKAENKSSFGAYAVRQLELCNTLTPTSTDTLMRDALLAEMRK